MDLLIASQVPILPLNRLPLVKTSMRIIFLLTFLPFLLRSLLTQTPNVVLNKAVICTSVRMAMRRSEHPTCALVLKGGCH